jgi:hypothetical protein
MRHLAATIAGAALLLTNHVGAAPPPPKTTTTAAKPQPLQPQRPARPLWQRDPTAKPFYRFGRAFLLSGGEPPSSQVPSLQKRFW